MSKRKKKNRHIGRKILFGIEIVVLILLVGVLFAYTQLNKKMDSSWILKMTPQKRVKKFR